MYCRPLDADLTEAGHEVAFFMDERVYWSVYYNYKVDAEREGFATFCMEKVCRTQGEADFSVLQLTAANAHAVALSNDKFRDYANAFPQLVGTQRLHTFSVFAKPTPMLFVIGLKAPIQLRKLEPAVTVEPELAPELACIEERQATPVTARAVEHAVSMFKVYRKALAHDPEALEMLATCYAEGVRVSKNFRKSATLDRVARESQKRVWQQERRQKHGGRFRKCA